MDTETSAEASCIVSAPLGELMDSACTMDAHNAAVMTPLKHLRIPNFLITAQPQDNSKTEFHKALRLWTRGLLLPIDHQCRQNAIWARPGFTVGFRTKAMHRFNVAVK